MTGAAKRWSTGISKKPWICPTWRSMVIRRLVPAIVSRSATSLAVMGTRGSIFPVLPGVTVVRQHRGYPAGRRPLEGVDHDEKLHQVLVDRRSRRLHHEHVRTTDVLGDLKRTSPSAKRDSWALRRNVQAPGDTLPLAPGYSFLRRASVVSPFSSCLTSHMDLKESKSLLLWTVSKCVGSPDGVAGAEGFEPSNTRIQSPGALPLGHAPPRAAPGRPRTGMQRIRPGSIHIDRCQPEARPHNINGAVLRLAQLLATPRPALPLRHVPFASTRGERACPSSTSAR